MAEGKHTDGPWSHEPQDGGPGNCYVAQVFAADGSVVADIAPRSNDEADANAALIASAPETAAERDRLKEINAELLAALVMTKSWLKSDPIWNAVITQPGDETFGKRIEAAISRATVTP